MIENFDLAPCMVSCEELNNMEVLGICRQLLYHFPDAVVISDRVKILYANRSALKMAGTDSLSVIVGRPISDFVHPNQLHEMKLRLDELFETNESITYSDIILTNGGNRNYVTEISSTRIYDNNGNPVLLSVIRDVTERKRSEELLIRSEKLSAIGQLAAGVAHEIRNPLAALKGFTQLLKSKLPDYGSYFNIMASEIDRINLIVNEFMTLAKPHYSHYTVGRLEPIIHSVLSILETQATLLNIMLRVELNSPLPVVLCSENQLKQVFLNIIKNALESMQGGGEVVITGNAPGNDMVEIKIKDAGPGMPEELIAKLGEPFFTTKEKGTGLGLMISSRIVAEHKGSLNITSQINSGTTITIRLPVYKQEPQA